MIILKSLISKGYHFDTEKLLKGEEVEASFGDDDKDVKTTLKILESI